MIQYVGDHAQHAHCVVCGECKAYCQCAVVKEQKMTQTLGEQRVRVSHNPSGQDDVDNVKRDFARLIDRMENVADDNTGEVRRLVALGHTAAEQACMWYVKALTADAAPPAPQGDPIHQCKFCGKTYHDEQEWRDHYEGHR